MGFFSKIFGNKGTEENTSGPFVNPVTTEFHSHLIFGVDDGCQTIEQSIELIRGFANMGMTKIITTPHVMSDFYKNSKDNIYPLRDEIRKRLAEENINIQFDAAAEYMIDDGFEKKIEAGNMLTFGKDEKHILVELPFMTEPRNFKECLFNLQIAGYTPILAHPERYLYYAADKEQYHELKERGILFQLNMLSCIGYYSKPVAEAAAYLVDRKMIDLIGSDTHHIRHQQLLPEVMKSKTFRKACSLELLNNNL